MPSTNQTQMFIGLLKDALDKHRLKKNEALALQGRARTQHFLRYQRQDITVLRDHAEPQDCVQMMSARDTVF